MATTRKMRWLVRWATTRKMRWLVLATASSFQLETRVSVVSVKPREGPRSTLTRVWDWKGAVLGLDMSLPRPKACRALADALVQGGVDEALVLSTCARLDFVLALKAKSLRDAEEAAVREVATTLAAQVEQWQNGRTPSFIYDFDLASETIRAARGARDAYFVEEIKKIVIPRIGTREAATHLARVATGLADAAPYDPFSSKQAFVQRQLRAALAACDRGPTGESIRLVVQTALETGKAVRRSDMPENQQFRARRDEQSRQLAKAAAHNATLTAADVVMRRLFARNASSDVAAFRAFAMHIADDAAAAAAATAPPSSSDSSSSSFSSDAAVRAARTAANRCIHDATVALRDHGIPPSDAVLAAVRPAATTAVLQLLQSSSSSEEAHPRSRRRSRGSS